MFDPWVGKNPWKRKWQPTPVSLLGKSHRQRSLAGCGTWDCKEPDTTEDAGTHVQDREGKRACQVTAPHTVPLPRWCWGAHSVTIVQVILRSEVQYLKNNGIFVLYYIFCHYNQYWLSRLKISDILLRTVRIFKERCLGKRNQACRVAFVICYFSFGWFLLLCLHSNPDFIPIHSFPTAFGAQTFPPTLFQAWLWPVSKYSLEKNFFTVICISAPQKSAVSLFAYNTCSSPTSFYPCPRAHEPELSKEFTLEIFLDLNWFNSAFAGWFRIINSSLALGRIGNILGSDDLPKVPDPSTITHVLFSSNSDCLLLTSNISGNWLLGFIFSHSKNPLLAPKRNVEEDSTVNDPPMLLHTLVAPAFLLTDSWVVSNFEL